MPEYKYRCVICPSVFKKNEMSFRDENEYDLDLCHKCLEGQREADRECEEPDPDHMRDFLEEVKELQELKRREI